MSPRLPTPPSAQRGLLRSLGEGARGRLAMGAVAYAAVAGAFACLPDLEKPPAAITAAPPPPKCGDGFVDPSEGEQCDPGDAGDAGVSGCSASCKLLCDGFLAPSGHCYFRLSGAMGFTEARARCLAARAHVVTFASALEVKAVLEAPGIGGLDAGAFWVGLEGLLSAGGYDYLAIADEPGFAPSPRCPGCYGHVGASGTPGGTFPAAGGVADSDTCVSSPGAFAQSAPWLRSSCNGPGVGAICERERAGSRGEACSGSICVSGLRTASSSTEKRYIYFPSSSTPEEAAQTCSELKDGRLVTFNSNEEREELFRELSLAGAFDARDQFWIGLSYDADAGAWLWDDGIPVDDTARPVPWGVGEPSAGPLRAYAQRANGKLDNQLAHAKSTVKQLPFVCQYQP